MFYLAENLAQRKNTFVDLLINITGISKNSAEKEFEISCERIFYYASMADKFEGNIHNPPIRGLTLAVKESIGVVACLLDNHQPLLSLSTDLSSLFSRTCTVLFFTCASCGSDGSLRYWWWRR